MKIIAKAQALAAMQGGIIPAPLQVIIDQPRLRKTSSKLRCSSSERKTLIGCIGRRMLSGRPCSGLLSRRMTSGDRQRKSSSILPPLPLQWRKLSAQILSNVRRSRDARTDNGLQSRANMHNQPQQLAKTKLPLIPKNPGSS